MLHACLLLADEAAEQTLVDTCIPSRDSYEASFLAEYSGQRSPQGRLGALARQLCARLLEIRARLRKCLQTVCKRGSAEAALHLSRPLRPGR